MLKDEVKIVLNNIESELLHFATFINELENKHREQLPREKKINQPKRTNSASEFYQKDRTSSRTALVDAFNLVKNVLIKICNLIDQVLSLTTSRESNLRNDSSNLENYYYTQYVYHIAFYLTNIVETNLFNFSEKLDKLTSTDSPERTDLQFPKRRKSPKIAHREGVYLIAEEPLISEYQDHNQYLQRRKLSEDECINNGCQPTPLRRTPEIFKFDYFKPATIFHQDGSMYLHSESMNPKSGLSSAHTSPNLQISSDFEEEQVHNSESNKIKQLKAFDFYKKKERTNEIFIRITNSLNSLMIIVQNLLDAIEEWMNSKSVECPKQVMRKRTPCRKKIIHRKHFKRCCSKRCSKCCDSCRNLHVKTGSEIHRSFWYDNMLPTLNPEPFCMQKNSPNKRQKKKVANRTKCVDDETITSPESSSERKKQFRTNRKMEISISHSEDKIPKNKNAYCATARSPRASREQKHSSCKDFKTQCPSLSEQSTSNDSESTWTSASEEQKVGTVSGQNGTFPVKDSFSYIPDVIRKKRTISKGTLIPSLRAYDWKLCVTNKNIESESSKTPNQQRTSTSTVPDQETPEDVENAKPRTKVSAEEKPMFARNLKEIVYDKLGGFGLFPKTKSNSGAKKDKANIYEQRDSAYPQSIVFKVNKFSNQLKEQLKDHFARNSDLAEESESNIILDIIINCLQESSDIQPEKDTTLYKDATSEGKTSATDELVKDAINVATQIADSKRDAHVGTSKLLGMKSVEGIEEKRRETVIQACLDCSKIKLSAESHDGKLCEKKIQPKKTLKGVCFKCWNAWQHGLTIHQCHDVLPPGILEIRHMDAHGKICVCFQEWDAKKEKADWRWKRSPFYDQTRVEVEQKATATRNPILKVIYGTEGTLVKESLAETRLKTVKDFSPTLPINTDKSRSLKERPKSVSKSWMKLRRSIPLTTLDKKLPKAEKKKMCQTESITITKISRFFVEIYNFGYGKGPPLVIKVRRQDALHDAYDILMAPSKIPLNYYRSLRVLYVSQPKDGQPTSTTNFEEEDESDELFELFERRLFSSGDMHIFEYPSEETHVLYLNPESQAHPQWFAFAGAVLALAFIHQKKMNIRIAHVLYKCLLDRPLCIHDLQEIDPLTYQKLMWMKENPIGDRKNQMKMTFMLREKIGQQVFENELIPNGANISVTDANKYRYIDLAVKWKLAEKSLIQLKDFRRGFSSVLDPCFLNLFNAKELQSLIRCPPNSELLLQGSSSHGRKKSIYELSRRVTC